MFSASRDLLVKILCTVICVLSSLFDFSAARGKGVQLSWERTACLGAPGPALIPA